MVDWLNGRIVKSKLQRAEGYAVSGSLRLRSVSLEEHFA